MQKPLELDRIDPEKMFSLAEMCENQRMGWSFRLKIKNFSQLKTEYCGFLDIDRRRKYDLNTIVKLNWRSAYMLWCGSQEEKRQNSLFLLLFHMSKEIIQIKNHFSNRINKISQKMHNNISNKWNISILCMWIFRKWVPSNKLHRDQFWDNDCYPSLCANEARELYPVE